MTLWWMQKKEPRRPILTGQGGITISINGINESVITRPKAGPKWRKGRQA